MIRIRPAVAADVPWIWGQLHEFDAVFPARTSLMPCPEYGDAMLRQLVSVGPFFMAVDIYADGVELVEEPAGFIAGMVAPHWMNPDVQVLTELLWWVAPDYRGSSAAARLLRSFVDYGKANAEWTLCTIGKETPVNPRSFERLGLAPIEATYLLEVG